MDAIDWTTICGRANRRVLRSTELLHIGTKLGYGKGIFEREHLRALGDAKAVSETDLFVDPDADDSSHRYPCGCAA